MKLTSGFNMRPIPYKSPSKVHLAKHLYNDYVNVSPKTYKEATGRCISIIPLRSTKRHPTRAKYIQNHISGFSGTLLGHLFRRKKARNHTTWKSQHITGYHLMSDKTSTIHISFTISRIIWWFIQNLFSRTYLETLNRLLNLPHKFFDV